MSQQELLIKVVDVLETSGIQYMLTGSYASSIQGEPRATHDIDLVVVIPPKSIKTFVAAFPSPEYYLDEDAVKDAILHNNMFNLLHVKEGNKVDFWILTDEPFDISRFSRRISAKFLGREIKFSAAEDTILMKLSWAKISGGSIKQVTDALRIYEVQYGGLDMVYLENWVQKLELSELWEQLKDNADPLDS